MGYNYLTNRTNGVQLSDWVENIVGKEEIARDEQFLFPQCFQKLSVVDASKWVFMELRVKRAFGELNNIFQDEFNKILSQQSTNVRFILSRNWILRIKLKNKGPIHTHLVM